MYCLGVYVCGVVWGGGSCARVCVLCVYVGVPRAQGLSLVRLCAHAKDGVWEGGRGRREEQSLWGTKAGKLGKPMVGEA